MVYSDYTLEEIMTYSNGDYQKICNVFLGLAASNEMKVKLENILYKGGYQDYSINSKICNKDNPFIEMQRRIAMANLLIRNPETFDILVQKKANMFHGTTANALPNILKYGLNSAYESEKIGIHVTTGERSTGRYNPRDFVSFTDVLDIAEDYSTIKPETENNNLSFEVIIGTTVDDIKQTGKRIIPSDVPEVGVNLKLPLENIKVIGVPSDKVEFVKRLTKDHNEITILAIDDINDKFYYVDKESEKIEILDNELEKFKNKLQEPKNSKVFGLEELKKLTLNRLLPMLERYFPNVIKKSKKANQESRGEEIYHEGRKH